MYFRNYKSRRKWQKAFINSVFSHKTKYNNTFSKIILENIELLEGKADHLPKSLFKFYKPSSDNIIDIQKQRLWMAHPESFNDPFDCRTGYDINIYEKHVLMTYIRDTGCVEAKDGQDGFTLDEFNRLSKSTTSYYYNWYSKIEEYDTVLRNLLENKSKNFDDKIHDVITKSRNEVDKKIDKLRSVNIRLASFSALDRQKGFDEIIQMWSHYADNHKGFCVEYDMSFFKNSIRLSLEDHQFYKDQIEYMDKGIKVLILAGLFPVIYTASRVNIPKTKLQKIKLDKNGGLQHSSDIDSIIYKTYIVKSGKWNYEKEWRVILDGKVCDYYDNKIPFPYIKRIFLGCKMTTQTKDTMIEIAEGLGAEVVLMEMDNEKFILEEHRTDHYKWEKEWTKRKNPFY